MSKFLGLIVLIFYFNQYLFCQDSNTRISKEFGVVSGDDFNYQPKDRDASAVVLFDKGESEFYIEDGGLDIRFHRQKRIKILQNSGLEYANIEIPYYVDGYGRTEVVKDINAYSYTFSNGHLNRKKVDIKEIFIEDINANWKQKKFAIPDVQLGSIIEYEYALETPFKFNLPDWQFQEYIPILYSEYTIQSVPFYEYVYLAQGITEFSDRRSFTSNNSKHSFAMVNYPDVRTTYIMENIPRFINEGYITSPDHYIKKMDFQLAKINFPRGGSNEIMTTWDRMNEDMVKHDDFGKYIKKSESIFPEYIADRRITSNSGAELAENIINSVKNDFNWNGRYGKYASQKPKELLEKKSGNAADINLYLVAALRSSGFKAYPILVSTRDHGRVFQQFPFSHFFNYVLVYFEVDGKAYMADATEPLLMYNRIPIRCLNQEGLLLKEKHCEWVNLIPHHPSTETIFVQYEIDFDDRSMDASIRFNTNELSAYSMKRNFENDTISLVKYFNTKGIENIWKLRISNVENASNTYSVRIKSHSSLSIIQDQVLIKPFLNFPYSENPFKLVDRTYPIDLTYPKATNFTVMMKIPPGYEISSLPQKQRIDNDAISVYYDAVIINEIIRINAGYEFKKALYMPEEYVTLQKGVDNIVSSFNQLLILDKSR